MLFLWICIKLIFIQVFFFDVGQGKKTGIRKNLLTMLFDDHGNYL